VEIVFNVRRSAGIISAPPGMVEFLFHSPRPIAPRLDERTGVDDERGRQDQGHPHRKRSAGLCLGCKGGVKRIDSRLRLLPPERADCLIDQRLPRRLIRGSRLIGAAVGLALAGLDLFADLIEDLVKAPDVTVTKLMNSTCGCAFLIRELTSIKQRLITHKSFEVSQREYCLRLAGHRPEELFTDPVVRDLNRSYLSSLQGPGFFTPAMAANAFMYDRPKEITATEFARRMEPFVKDLVSKDEGWDQLKTFVRDRIERLKERMELMGYREARQLNAALGVAQSPCDRDGEKTTRYMNQSDRIFFAAVRLLQSLKNERRKHSEDKSREETTAGQAASPEPERPETASASEEKDLQTDGIPADNDPSQNEPETTQVVAQPAANNTTGPGPGCTVWPAVRLSAEDDVAIRAQYRQSVEKTMRYFNERTGNGPPGPAQE
jgi:hypothetical protein